MAVRAIKAKLKTFEPEMPRLTAPLLKVDDVPVFDVVVDVDDVDEPPGVVDVDEIVDPNPNVVGRFEGDTVGLDTNESIN